LKVNYGAIISHMRNRVLLLLVAPVSLASCLGMEPPQAASGETAIPTHQAAVIPQPQVRLPEPAARVSFDLDIAPIFSSRCQPCHFPGGKMYERLPFDQAATIRKLGPALFSRIKDKDERARIQAFLDAAQTAPENLPQPLMR